MLLQCSVKLLELHLKVSLGFFFSHNCGRRSSENAIVVKTEYDPFWLVILGVRRTVCTVDTPEILLPRPQWMTVAAWEVEAPADLQVAAIPDPPVAKQLHRENLELHLLWLTTSTLTPKPTW